MMQQKTKQQIILRNKIASLKPAAKIQNTDFSLIIPIEKWHKLYGNAPGRVLSNLTNYESSKVYGYRFIVKKDKKNYIIVRIQ